MIQEKVLLESLKGFGSAQQADCVPDTEQAFLINSKELRAIIKAANRPYIERIEHLEMWRADVSEVVANLTRSIRKDPTSELKDKADILHLLIAASGGKMLSIDARKKMKMPKSSFSKLVKQCDFLIARPSSLDPRKNLLEIKSMVHEP